MLKFSLSVQRPHVMRSHKDTKMNSCGFWEGPTENAHIQGPEFCATFLIVTRHRRSLYNTKCPWFAETYSANILLWQLGTSSKKLYNAHSHFMAIHHHILRYFDHKGKKKKKKYSSEHYHDCDQ